MAATRPTARLLEAAERAGVKVVAIGDPRQLASVQAGGWLGAIGRALGAQQLTEVMRQRNPAESRALGALGQERSYGPVEVAVGDRVICWRNDKQLDVDNGMRGNHRPVEEDATASNMRSSPIAPEPAATPERGRDRVPPEEASTCYACVGRCLGRRVERRQPEAISTWPRAIL